MLAYRAILDVSRELAQRVSRLVEAERRRRGTRALKCFRQAVLGLRWFRQDAEIPALGRDHGVSRATAYRYVDEVIKVLAAQAPDLHEALQHAKEQGIGYVVLDGNVFSADRCGEKAISVKGKPIDVWYSGKAHEHGGNIQALSAPGGFPLWVADVEPGSTHDLTAARDQVLGALYWAASQLDLPTLVDGGYQGTGIGVHTPITQPSDGRKLGSRQSHLQRAAARTTPARRTWIRRAHRALAHPAAQHRQPKDRQDCQGSPCPHPDRTRPHMILLRSPQFPAIVIAHTRVLPDHTSRVDLLMNFLVNTSKGSTIKSEFTPDSITGVLLEVHNKYVNRQFVA